ncbi:MAG: hypothetical protein MZV70_18260 [Desulfobacterales bacterium]|nr:hypothetical protein [Desulfobacterales bacterium]
MMRRRRFRRIRPHDLGLDRCGGAIVWLALIVLAPWLAARGSPVAARVRLRRLRPRLPPDPRPVLRPLRPSPGRLRPMPGDLRRIRGRARPLPSRPRLPPRRPAVRPDVRPADPAHGPGRPGRHRRDSGRARSGSASPPAPSGERSCRSIS